MITFRSSPARQSVLSFALATQGSQVLYKTFLNYHPRHQQTQEGMCRMLFILLGVHDIIVQLEPPSTYFTFVVTTTI
jgi:hypothetical protein